MAHSLALNDRMSQAIESALIHGDLKDLDTAGRVEFYNAVCRSLGLNPLTKPFAYIVLNGKLTLYALKDCTEQLRKIHGVSITAVEPKQIGELLVVVATARDGQGKVDSSTGAVSIGNLKGEALANAMMKAETKAKRRVTLSICGLGLLDESEVQTLREQGVAHEDAGKSPEQIAAEKKWDAIDPPRPAEEKEHHAPPAADEGPFSQTGDRLTCVILAAQDKTTKPGKNGQRPFVSVIFNGRIDGFNYASCFDTALFEALHYGVGKECELYLKYEKGDKFINISDVSSIDGVEYVEGKPVPLLNRQLKAALALEAK